MEVDDSGKDGNSGEKVHDVWEMGSVEGFAKGSSLVGPGDQQVEEGNDRAFELFATASVDCSRRKGSPDNRLADAGGNEEGDTRAETIALLEQLIEQNDNQTSNNKLDNQQEADTSAEVGWLAIETSQDEDTSLTEGEDDGEQLLGSLIEFSIGFEVEVDVNQMGAGQELCKVLVVCPSVHDIQPYLEDHAR